MMKNPRESLLNFQLDDPEAGLSFTRRLSRENGWSPEYSAQVVREYLRFLVLCSEAGHHVTPSDAVDQVWHLHLCYTESYWVDLCEKLLEFPLHHGPTKGGRSERKKYFDWYEKTLDSYRTLFGEKPPVDIWPEPRRRFSRQDFRRVDCERNFILPKKALSFSAAGLATGCGLAGCASGFVPASAGFGMFLFFALVVLILVVLVRKSGGGGGGGGTGGCGGGFFGGFGGGSDGDSGCGGGGCGGGCGS